MASKLISVNFFIYIRKKDENNYICAIDYPSLLIENENSMIEKYTNSSKPFLSSALTITDQGGRSKYQKKDDFEMSPNPEFDTQSWPSTNANGMKSS